MQINKTAYQKYYFSASLIEQGGGGIPQNKEQIRCIWKWVFPLCTPPVPNYQILPRRGEQRKSPVRMGTEGITECSGPFPPRASPSFTLAPKEINNAGSCALPVPSVPHLQTPGWHPHGLPPMSTLESPEVTAWAIKHYRKQRQTGSCWLMGSAWEWGKVRNSFLLILCKVHM